MQVKDQTGLFTAKLSVKNLLRDSEESALFETIGITNIDARGIIHDLELQRSQYIRLRTIPQAVYDACLQGIRHKYNNLTHPFPTRILPTTGMLGVMHIGIDR